MDGDTSKSHVGMPGGLSSNLVANLHIPTTLPTNLSSHIGGKTIETENLEIVANIQEMLNQLFTRGINSMLVTVGPFGDAGIHGSHKGQTFLKENADIVDRFSKLCTEDMWTLIGAQKRFLELGRTNQNKAAGNYNDKGDYPLDFSHERNNYFPGQTNDRSNAQDNSFVQGILAPTGNQNKGYQSNSFIPGSFGQYVNENRQTYPAGSFFQGGFTQGVACSESYPQASFMQSMETAVNKDSYNTIVNNVMQGTTSATSTPSMGTHDNKQTAGLSQTEDDLLKEMLNNTPLQDVFKDTGQKSKEKEKSQKIKEEKEEKRRDAEKRKRERRPETWQRNIKKKLKTEGKAYVNAKGKVVPAKELKTVDCSNCKQKCTEKISEETRKKIFEWFWKLGSYTAQKEFVVSRVTQVQTKTHKRRNVHRLFSFEINGKYESVCKPFFSKTLGIGDSYIYKAFEQKARDLFVQDGRGKHAPVNKTSEEQVEFMHEHLDKYLVTHALDKPLPKNIHAVKWYEEYVIACAENDGKAVSKHIYRKIFQEYVRRYPTCPDKKKTVGASTSSNEASDMSSS